MTYSPETIESKRPRPKSRRTALGADALRITELERQISEKDKVIEAQVNEARHDKFLTTMLHKDEFIKSFSEKIETNNNNYVGLFFIDINHFKAFNDTTSHQKGDELLRFYESRLNELFARDEDDITIIEPEDSDQGRMGGDEFAISVVLGKAGGMRTMSPSEQMTFLQEKLRTLEGDIVLNYQHFMPKGKQLGMSIGTAVFSPEEPEPAEELIKSADLDMYKDKREHRKQERRRKIGRWVGKAA